MKLTENQPTLINFRRILFSCAILIFTGSASIKNYGCDYYVTISTANDGLGVPEICIHPGESVPLYALHMYNFITYFNDPVRQLVWTRDGIPFDTTDHTQSINTSGIWYVTTVYVNQPGVYQVVYHTPMNELMIIGQVTITMCTESNAMHTETSSITEESKPEGDNWKIYPNPVSGGTFYITNSANHTDASLVIFDAAGLQIYASTGINDEIITINTSSFRTGIYFISINMSGTVIRKKVIVN